MKKTTENMRDNVNEIDKTSSKKIPFKRLTFKKIVVAVAVVAFLSLSYIYFTTPHYSGNIILASADTPSKISQSTLDEKYINSLQTLGSSVLLETIKKDGGKNQLVSPLSLSMCFSMIMSGARDQTYSELKKALGYGDMSDADILAQNKAAYEKSYLTDKALKIRIANGIWFDKNYGIKNDFLNLCKSSFYADVFGEDFSKTDKLLKDVNTWVNHKSEGKIPNILDKVSPDDVMYLINAVYFEGKWENPFDKNKTKPQDFYLSNNTTIQADFMHSSESVKYKGTDNFEAVSIPYKGGMSMVLALPPKGHTPTEILSNQSDMQTILSSQWTYSQELIADKNGSKHPEFSSANVIMPMFKFQKEMDLIPIMQDLGVKEAFSDSADFSGMDPQNNLYVGMAKQKTFISVDEKQTIAAAVTIGGMRNESISMSTSVVFDRPFIFSIVDSQGMPLFVGVTQNPNQG